MRKIDFKLLEGRRSKPTKFGETKRGRERATMERYIDRAPYFS